MKSIDDINEKVAANVASAKANLKKFDETLGKPYKTANGSYDFSAERTTVLADTADKLLNKAIKDHPSPKLPAGISGYRFEINYKSL